MYWNKLQNNWSKHKFLACEKEQQTYQIGHIRLVSVTFCVCMDFRMRLFLPVCCMTLWRTEA